MTSHFLVFSFPSHGRLWEKNASTCANFLILRDDPGRLNRTPEIGWIGQIRDRIHKYPWRADAPPVNKEGSGLVEEIKINFDRRKVCVKVLLFSSDFCATAIFYRLASEHKRAESCHLRLLFVSGFFEVFGGAGNSWDFSILVFVIELTGFFSWLGRYSLDVSAAHQSFRIVLG